MRAPFTTIWSIREDLEEIEDLEDDHGKNYDVILSLSKDIRK